ncbi:transposase [Serratia ureilytica]
MRTRQTAKASIRSCTSDTASRCLRGYNALYENGRITEAACMVHTRRKIHDVHASTPTDIRNKL